MQVMRSPSKTIHPHLSPSNVIYKLPRGDGKRNCGSGDGYGINWVGIYVESRNSKGEVGDEIIAMRRKGIGEAK